MFRWFPSRTGKLRNRSCKRAARRQRKPSPRLGAPRLVQLEARLAPSVLSTFELDGNATTGVVGPPGSTTPSHDWDQVFADAGNPTPPSGTGSFAHGASSQAVAGSFEYDLINTTSDTIFTGGGSKDVYGIQSGPWKYTTSKPQAKDDIENLFASAYTDSSNGHVILYAGMTRYDNSGDATAGFWFLQDPTFSTTTPTPPSSGAPFAGKHMDGDILLVSDFSTGGSVATVSVYKWVGDDATGSLQFVGGNSTNTFAIVNGSTLTLPWTFTDKGKTGGTGSNQAAQGEFLEEGVDLTALGLSGCFSTFEGETRSSTSPSATLSDFGFGSFPLCSLTAIPQPGLDKVGDSFTYHLIVQNTGATPLYIQNVNDNNPPSGQVSVLGNIVVNGVLQQPGAAGVNPYVTAISSNFNFSQPLAAGAKLDIAVTRTVQPGDPDPTINTVTFTGNDKANFSDTPITTTVIENVNLFQPSAALSLTASPTSGTVGTPITYTYTVTNTSSSDSPNLVLDSTNQGAGDPNTLTDTLLGDLEADAIHAFTGSSTATRASIPPGASFSFTETRPIMSSDLPGPVTDSALARFTLEQNLGNFSNIIPAQSQVVPVNIVDASISIAPDKVDEVGDEHTFVVTVTQTLNGVTSAAVGANVHVTLTNANGASYTQFDGVPLVLSGTTDSNGHFSVSFTSQTAGEVIGSATADLTVSGVALHRATGDGQSGDTGAATKRFVDATVTIAPNATNGITEAHTFTVMVMQNDGLGGGFVPAVGASVAVTLTNSGGASYTQFDGVPLVLSGTTDANGNFQVTFTSDTAGQVIGNATAMLTVSGVPLTRATGDSHSGDSGPATKTFVSGSLKWLKINGDTNQPLGGATFVVTATGGTAALSDHTPTSVTVVDNTGQPGYTGFDADPRPGYFQLNAYQSYLGTALGGLAMGTYTVQETVAPAGFTLDPSVKTATLTASAPNADLTSTPFVDTLPHLTITKIVGVNGTFGGTSEVIKPGDTASFKITVSNTGAGAATNVLVTDQLPDPSQLTWTVTTQDGFDTATIGGGGDPAGYLRATKATLLGNTSISISVSAMIPLNLFGPPPGTPGNGDPVPLNLFELDANATTGDLTSGGGGPSTTPSHDWDQVFADAGSPSPATGFGDFTTTGPQSGASSGSFEYDPVNGNDNIFTGGGSKDISGIQSGPWLSTTGKPQGKDDIENTYAALYNTSNGDEVLYAGATRFDNSGDATLGFWFFKGPVSSTAGKSQHFTGTHTDGDILVISDFSIGGSVSTPVVYVWVGDDATGHLSGPIPTPAGTTDAVVNGSNITLPWTFTNKSKVGGNTALPGEFLELGINLTGLGLSSCFSSFLAETRSSTSPSATLSDFVVGKFPTCILQLPNQATVSADFVAPITSNQVLITVTPTGMAEMPTAHGSGAGTAILTDQELQSVVSQAIAAWRAAGVSPQTLSTLNNYDFHIATLPGGALGYEVPGQIFIDPTAAGWGWSTTGAPGRMDLLTVVSHEVGHALGLGDQAGANDVMTGALAPGVRRLPEPLSSSGTAVGTAAAPASFGLSAAVPTARAGQLESALPSAPLSTAPRTQTIAALLVPAVRDGGALLVPAGVTQDGAASGPAQPGALLNVGHPTAPLFSGVATAPAAVPVGSDLVPGLWPPSRRLEKDGGDTALPNDDVPDEVPAPGPAGPLVDPEADNQVEALARQRVSDRCFADRSWMAEPADPALLASGAYAPDAATVAAALVMVLGGWWDVRPAESDPRRRPRLPIGRI
jgi:uncharacterized repeat protein (TIGR01451 family)